MLCVFCFQNILEKFNPGARQMINAGKAYLKALHGELRFNILIRNENSLLLVIIIGNYFIKSNVIRLLLCLKVHSIKRV